MAHMKRVSAATNPKHEKFKKALASSSPLLQNKSRIVALKPIDEAAE
jgi:hypothetical protein